VEFESKRALVKLYTDDELFINDLLIHTDSKILSKKTTCSEQWYKCLNKKPFELVEGVWIDPSGRMISDEEVVIKMAPSAAFGTGDHPTTKLAARFLAKHLKESCSVLDVGCGSGILGILAKLLGASSVLCVDIDDMALEVAHFFAEENAVSVEFKKSDLLSNVSGVYDIVVANIVTPVLMKLIDQLECVTNNSTVIFSGITKKEKPVIIEALRKRGLSLLEEEELNSWVALVIKTL